MRGITDSSHPGWQAILTVQVLGTSHTIAVTIV
jgi:hypothetical protein